MLIRPPSQCDGGFFVTAVGEKQLTETIVIWYDTGRTIPKEE